MILAERLADVVDAVRPGRRVLVAVDGPDAAGKTTLARAVADRLRRPAVCVCVDRWHHPREVRLRRGDESAQGYYLDAFDHVGLLAQCLQPFASGAQTVRTARFDHLADREVEEHQQVPHDAALLVEGVFLLRPELRALWDLRIYLHVPEAVTLARAVARDRELLGGEAQVRRRYERRYLPGQALYREAAAPLDAADILVDNSDPARPVVLRWVAWC